MTETRIFYKPVILLGKQLQVCIPANIVNGLEIKDRDEVEISIKKTGKIIEKSRPSPKKPFGHEASKVVAESQSLDPAVEASDG